MRRPRRSHLMGSHTAATWNAAHPVGTRVRYWPVLPPIESAPPVDTTTRSEAWVLGDGAVVVKIVGRSGGVHLAHIELPDERAMVAIENAGKMWRAVAERDSAIARAEKAESERDEARAEVARRDALAVSTELMTRTQIDQIRAESKTLVAELVTALAGLERRFLGPKPGDPGGPCWCGEDRPRWLGHEDCCDVARSALAKAKGATP